MPTPDAGDCTPPAEACAASPPYAEDLSACTAVATDYRPREAMSANDAWPACISDDGVYHPINPSISTVGRVAAFDEIAQKLWACDKRPTAQEFVDARVTYAVSEGLDSRVQRRHDVHYPAPPGGASCADPAIAMMYPDRCVGPMRILPILNDAFAKGSMDVEPRVQAARIEAALLWFMYVSALSEVMSCTEKPQDCDSSWAYYTGGTPRDLPAGFARYVRAEAPATHDRAYDATLATRCWRNLDNETGTATNLALRDRARDQLDRATLRGIALVVRRRVSELQCTSGEVQQARFAFVKTLLPFLDRAARERDPARADVLAQAAAAGSPAQLDASASAALIAALDALFGCP